MIFDLLSRYGYHSFLAVGAVSMLVLTLWRRQRYNFSVLSACVFSVVLLAVGVLGAKLLFFVESSFTSFEGMSFFGSVYLVMLLMPIAGLLFRLKPAQMLDACAPCVASIISFMRFGCFCAGCCGGVMCIVGGYKFHWPTQLIEGFGDLWILALLLSLERQKDTNGKLYPMFLLTYGSLRFVIEFFRATPKNMLGFSEGQWLALMGILISALWIRGLRKEQSRK